MTCRLCHHSTEPFEQSGFFLCTHCGCILRDDVVLPSPEDERTRYLTHNNDIHDEGYRTFTRPITQHILDYFTPQHRGLDYGAGTGPVISQVLHEQGYNIVQYDPFFSPNREVLNRTYDFIACCEVVEHFHHPDKEFASIRDLLNPGGAFVGMTHLYSANILFANWYYKNDPTHVIIYVKQTLEYIAQSYGLRLDIHSDRMFVLSKEK